MFEVIHSTKDNAQAAREGITKEQLERLSLEVANSAGQLGLYVELLERAVTSEDLKLSYRSTQALSRNLNDIVEKLEDISEKLACP